MSRRSPQRTLRTRTPALGHAALLALLVPTAACTYAPLRTIPDPLPEVREWALAERPAGAFLGLKLVENDSGSLEDLSFASGLRVAKVVANSPAAQAGVQLEDVVLEADGVELFAPEDVAALLAGKAGGDSLVLNVQRGDTVFEVPIVLTASGDGATPVKPLYHLDPARSRAAWADGDRGAVLVARPDAGPVRDLPIGALVTAIDDQQILSGRGLVRELARRAPASKVTLTARARDGRSQAYDVKLLGEGRVVTRASVPVLVTYDADLEADRRSFVLIDLWLISLLRYERDGNERSWRVLRFFQWSSGVGELGE